MPRRTSHRDSTFGRAFAVQRTTADDWYDPKLHADTAVFVDPFLMFDEPIPPWNTVESRVLDFFNEAISRIAKSRRNHASLEWQLAAAMFSFPEPPEFCLGYGAKTIFGSGSGQELGLRMLTAAEDAIQLGVDQLADFGELMLFGESFGSDRVSDMICNIVKDLFVGYTIEISQRHGLTTSRVPLIHVGYDYGRQRWRNTSVELPINPCWLPRTPVLLVPERFVDDLPVMEDDNFWDWVYHNRNEQLRAELGLAITHGLKKEEILALARQRPGLRRRFGVQYAQAKRQEPPDSYDFDEDPKWLVRDFRTVEAYADQIIAEVPIPAAVGDFAAFIDGLIAGYKHLIEKQGLWKNFWSGSGYPYDESQAQDLFQASISHVCELLNIDVTPEANAGRGPVDFKFSGSTLSLRALVELKFGKSSSYWPNIEFQLRTYMESDQIPLGRIIVVQHTDAECEDTFVDRTNKLVSRVAAETGYDYAAIFVDVRPRPSASKRTEE